ncbi:MAG: hypothetical protein U9Q40_01045 [Campylobacterota bacterium]|nr:hypothetical protein [Campylobacterota bacterium]
MKKIIIMSLLATVIIAGELDLNSTVSTDTNATELQETKAVEKPNVYAALGNVIYGNIENIEKLKEVKWFKSFNEKIKNYSREVYKAKETGFEIESGSKRVDGVAYLEKLRELSKENDYFVRSVKIAYKSAIEEEDSLLFTKMVNSGLLDTDKRKDEIISYYLSHSEDINATGVIEKYLDDERTKAKRKSYTYEQAKKLREEAKIKRIREDDKRKQAKLEHSLTQEVKQKKIEIRENQKKELFN